MKTYRSVVAGVLIDNENRVLIVKRSKNESSYASMWELPSGKVDHGEDPNEAIIREFKEETNLNVKALFPFKVTHYTIDKPDSKRHTVQIIYFVKKTSENEIKLNDDEHEEFAWITPDDFDKYDIIDDVKTIINNALGFIKTHKINF